MRSFSVISGENALAQQFTNLRADARGGSFLLAQQMLGFFTLSTNPTNTKTLTLTINGTAVVFTFVSSIGATPGNVLIAGTAAGTAANLVALLNQPQTTTAAGVALSSANQTLLSYLSYALPSAGTTLYILDNNTSLYSPRTSFSASTTATSDSFTAQTMQLYVHGGAVYVNGTRVLFLGGATPTVTAPASNPRIDVLTVDNTGTLAWTGGAENASPTAPTYPSNKVPICELYNVTSETVLVDFDNQAAGKGYIYNDVRPSSGLLFNPSAIPITMLPAADATYDLGSASFEWNNIYAKTGIFVNNVGVAIAKFGGTGTDGALTSTSGTTTINASSAMVVEKNYTSISLTATATLTISNPATNGTILWLRSQAGATLTSTTPVNMSSMGATGATGQTTTSGGAAGSTGTSAVTSLGTLTAGGGGGAPGTGSAGSGGTAPTALFLLTGLIAANRVVSCGAGGAAGGTANMNPSTTLAGGRGGGALIIECLGAYNFTGTITTAGAVGGAASAGSAGGGGGGGGGDVLVLCGSITADSGTYTVSGGSGGSGAGSGSPGGGGGAGGASSTNNGTAGNAGTGTSGGSGGAGGNGNHSTVLNKYYS